MPRDADAGEGDGFLVTTVYRGASSEIVESAVTKPLEDSIAGIDGIAVRSAINRRVGFGTAITGQEKQEHGTYRFGGPYTT
mgnify:CR=1 FL=1